MSDKVLSFKSAFKDFYSHVATSSVTSACLDNFNNSKNANLQNKISSLDSNTTEKLQRLRKLEKERLNDWEHEKTNKRISAEELNPELESSSKQLLTHANCDETLISMKKECPSVNLTSRSLYIFFLKSSTKEESVLTYFESYGEVEGCCIEREKKTGLSRKFGYVMFKLAMSIERVLLVGHHVIDGQEIKFCRIENSIASWKGRRLFVSLPKCVQETNLRAYVQRWKKQKVNIFVKKNQNCNESRSYGYITFQLSFMMHDFLKAGPHYVNGHKIHLDFYHKKLDETIVSQTLIVYGLSPHTSDTSLKAYFELFGAVEGCVVMKQKNSQISRGFGYIVFEWSPAVSAVANKNQHFIDGKVVTIYLPVKNKLEAEDSRLITVNNLDVDTTEDILIDYFDSYDMVEACLIERDPFGKSKGRGFVVFQHSDTVKKVLCKAPHEIDYQNVVCLPGKESKNINFKCEKQYAKKDFGSSKGHFKPKSGKSPDMMKILDNSRKFYLPKVNLNNFSGAGVNLFKDPDAKL